MVGIIEEFRGKIIGKHFITVKLFNVFCWMIIELSYHNIFLPGIMEELQTRLQPALALVQNKQVSSPQLGQYIRTKYHLVNK